MRILMLADASSYHTYRWADTLRALGNEVLIVSLERGLRGDSVFLEGKLGKLKYIAAIPRIREVEEFFSPDLVFSHFIPNYGLIGKFLRTGRKVLAVWGSDLLRWTFKTPLHRLLSSSILSSYDFVVVDARFMREILEKLGVNPERIRVIPFGVPQKVRLSNLVDLPKSPLRFVSLRRHERDFNHGEILKFLKMLSRDFEIEVIYLQGGSETERIGKTARDLLLNPRFLGNLRYEDYLNVLRGSHFCISIPHRDGLSVSLLEAMASGCVPIVSDIPANREWVDGESGILVRPDAREMYTAFKEVFSWRWWEKARRLNKEKVIRLCNWEENVRGFLKEITST